MLGDLFSCILQREGLADNERGEHYQQKSRIHSEAHTHDRPDGAAENGVECQSAKQYCASDL